MRNATGDTFAAEPSHSRTTSTLLVIMATVIFLENATVCLLFACRSKLRTITNIFVVSLAMSDLFVGVLFVPVYLGTAVGHHVNLYIVTFLLFSSLFNLCGVTYDRYHAILQPLTYHAVFTCRRITTILVSVWFFPLLFIALPLIWSFQSLRVVIIVSRIYLGLMVLIVFFICVVISKVYYSIFKAIKRQLKMTRHVKGMFCHLSSPCAEAALPNHCGNGTTSPLGAESPRLARTALLSTKCAAESSALNEGNARTRLARQLMMKLRFKKQSKKLLMNFRAAKLFALIILIFVICWLPVVIINFMLAIDRVMLVPKFIFDVSIYAFVANALVNPLIYTFYKSDYRRAFLEASGCKKRRKQFNASMDLLELTTESMKRE